jgi:pimeloyl-ACP methyl ester carboxylesterase
MMKYFGVFLGFTLFLLAGAFVFTGFAISDFVFTLATAAGITAIIFAVEVIIHRYPPHARKYLGLALLGVLFFGLAAMIGWLWLRPVSSGELTSRPNPAASYQQAVARIEAMQSLDDPSINPVCRTRFLSHGQKTAKTIVLLHGLSNCPAQMEQLGQALSEQGYNVLIPRFPHHGKLDRMTTAQANLTAEEITQLGDEVADIAQGLGDDVTIAGFSMGGALTAWLAQQRPDLDRAVLIAPALGFAAVPAPSTDLAASALLESPGAFMWWDPLLKENHRPAHGYPRFSTDALGQLLRVGASVREQSALRRPATSDIMVITNDNDLAVNSGVIDSQVQQWRHHGAAVETYTFPAEMKLDHDLIDPASPYQQVEQVYPVLLSLIVSDTR